MDAEQFSSDEGSESDMYDDEHVLTWGKVVRPTLVRSVLFSNNQLHDRAECLQADDAMSKSVKVQRDEGLRHHDVVCTHIVNVKQIFCVPIEKISRVVQCGRRIESTALVRYTILHPQNVSWCAITQRNRTTGCVFSGKRATHARSAFNTTMRHALIAPIQARRQHAGCVLLYWLRSLRRRKRVCSLLTMVHCLVCGQSKS